MSTAIVYVTKHGATAKVATLIAERLGDAVLINLAETPAPDLTGFDTVVVGGPIYAGQPMKQIKQFVSGQAETLASRALALFVCGMEPDLKARQAEIAQAFPQALRAQALGTWFLGGEFRFETMGLFEKVIIKQIAHTNQSVSAIDDDAITDLVEAVTAASSES